MASSSTKIVRQSNPGGRTTYYIPDQFGMRRITRPAAMFLVSSGQAEWAGAPKPRVGGPGAPSIDQVA